MIRLDTLAHLNAPNTINSTAECIKSVETKGIMRFRIELNMIQEIFTSMYKNRIIIQYKICTSERKRWIQGNALSLISLNVMECWK